MFDKGTIEYIANLARLEITEDEKVSFSQKLGSILEYMEQLSCINTEGVEPTSFMVPQHNPLRDDIENKSLSIEQTLRNGPSIKKGFFAVPKVIG